MGNKKWSEIWDKTQKEQFIKFTPPFLALSMQVYTSYHGGTFSQIYNDSLHFTWIIAIFAVFPNFYFQTFSYSNK